jgi:glycosyltransferase involved in cell wall biosynthesis
MRVAILNHGIFPFLLGGMERHTHFLATHMARQGAEVDVIVPGLDREQTEAFAGAGHPYRLVQKPWPAVRPWLRANYLFSRAANEHLTAGGFDAIYGQGFNAWAYLREVRRDRRAFTVVNPHGMEMFKTVGLWQTAKHLHMRWAVRSQAALADRVISSGGHLTGETMRFLGVAPDRIDVIPNGVDPAFLDAFARDDGPRAASPGNRFVFVGRLAANKGLHVLCEAFARVPAADLSIVGGGPLEPELRAAFARPNIRFLGRLDDPALFRLQRQADGFVFASLYEGMPTVILEAMTNGLPVIATDIGAVTTMVDDANGIVIPPGSADALEAALGRFLALPAEARQAMGRASRARVEERFAWPAVARRTLELFERHRRPRR